MTPPVTRSRVCVVVLALLVAGVALVGTNSTARADDFPEADEVRAARAAVDNASATVEELDAALATLEQVVEDTRVRAQVANERYVAAQEDNSAAQRRVSTTADEAATAELALDEANATMAQLAMAEYRDGGSWGTFGAIVTADGLEDALFLSEARYRASMEANVTVHEVQTAQLAAEAMRVRADEAADAALVAEREAQFALESAHEARESAEAALVEVESTRAQALERLAQLRNVSIELEQERQEGLAAARAEREREEFEDSGGGPSAPGGNPPGSNPPDDNPPGGGSSGGESPGTGSWASSASQGQQAVDSAMSRLGAEYVLGGTGPGYDCSGLTMTAWASAGFSIPRTSKAQYQGLTQVPFADRRPGDLLFWGTNRSSSQIYHTAMYIGNGQIVEASNYGIPVRVRDYDAYSLDKLLPTVGRP